MLEPTFQNSRLLDFSTAFSIAHRSRVSKYQKRGADFFNPPGRPRESDG